MLPPIVVTPSSYSIVEEATSAHDVDMTEAANLPLLDNDILRTVHAFPGVASNDFTARFHLRGSERSGVLVRLDGVDLYEPFHLQDFGGPLSIIDRSLVGAATLLMGAYPASYGSATAGVFDITTRSPGREKRATLGLDLLKMMFVAEGGVRDGDASYLFAARRGYVDLVLGVVDAIQPLDETFRPRYTDMYAKIDVPLEGGASLTASSLYGRDTNLMDKAGEDDDLESEYVNSVTWMRWRNAASERWAVEAIPYVGFATGDRVEGQTEWDRRDLMYAGVKGSVAISASAAHRPEIGVELRLANGVYDYREDVSPFPELADSLARIAAIADVGGLDASVYAQDEWRVSDTVGVEYGGRALWQSYLSTITFSPRVAVAARAVGDTTWRVGVGSVAGPVGPLNIPVESGVGDPTRPERVAHFVGGVEWSPSARLSIRGEGYYKDLSSLVGRERDIGRKAQYYRLSDSGTARGWELFARGRPGSGASWTAGYAYAVSTRELHGVSYPSDFDRRHTILLNGSVQLAASATLTAAWRFHTGTPVSPVRFARDGHGQVVSAAVGLPDGEETTPAFHSLDLRLTKVYGYTGWDLTAYLQVTNAYARGNVQEYSYDAADDYAREEENFLPITPTFGVTATF